MTVSPKDQPDKISIIKITGYLVYFDKSGYYDPDGINFSGEMTDQRIGDMLPLEYKLN